MEYTNIYSLSDPVTGEIRYIGKTCNQLRKRLYAHINECKSDNKSHKISWIKSILLNDKAPIISIIDIVPTSEWEFWEKYWIEQFKQWGFNLTNISKGGYENNYKRSNQTRDRMRKSKLGITLSEEHKKKISKSVKDNWKDNPREFDKKYIIDRDLLYNKYIIENLSMPKLSKIFDCSPTTVFRNLKDNNISKDKDSWKDQLSNGKKEVIQYDLSGNFIKEWTSVMEVKKEYSGNISSCCRGESLSASGYIWRYKNEYIEIDLDKLNYNKRKVKKMDKDGNIVKVYNSIKEASFDGFNESNIQDCCVHRLKTHRGFIWRYFEDNSPIIHSKVIKKIIQYDLSGDFIKEWPSIISASKELNIGSNNISMCCSGKYKTCGGYIWKYKKSILRFYLSVHF